MHNYYVVKCKSIVLSVTCSQDTHPSFFCGLSAKADNHIDQNSGPKAEQGIVHVVKVPDNPNSIVLLPTGRGRVEEIQHQLGKS